MLLGILKDEQTLKEAKVTSGVKLMVVGSTLDDVISVSPPDPSQLKETKSSESG